jgi:NADP-dependent 3-hydroxy acid dehydrogenase YdfG
LITGASTGVGASVAEVLRDAGARVIRVARSLAAGATAHQIDLPADLATDEGIARVREAVDRHGVPDIVVSNAGGFSLGAIAATPASALDELYRINLRAPFALAGLMLPRMRERGSGRHILIGSIADHRAFPGNAAYAATKFGARGLHEVLREEYQGTGVLCSLISPGPVDTPLWDSIDPGSWSDLPNRSAMLKPEDVALAVRWVATRPSRVDVPVLELGPA